MKYITILSFLFFFQSCELYPKPPSCNTPEELEKAGFSNSKYESLVFSYLEKSQPEDYRYFFKTFIEGESGTFMLVNFRNIDTCFDVNILVDDWSKLNGMRKVNGKSYPKELRNLKWELKSGGLVKYIDMDRIID